MLILCVQHALSWLIDCVDSSFGLWETWGAELVERFFILELLEGGTFTFKMKTTVLAALVKMLLGVNDTFLNLLHGCSNHQAVNLTPLAGIPRACECVVSRKDSGDSADVFGSSWMFNNSFVVGD